MLKFFKEFTPKKLFFMILSVFTLASIIVLLATRGGIINYLEFGDDGYMDFFNHIAYVDNPSKVYFTSMHACFPPLVYLFYLFLNRMLPAGSVVMYNADVSASAMLLYIIYVIICSIVFFYVANKHFKFNFKLEKFFVFLGIFISNTFILGVVERGNSTFLVLICIMLALQFKDSESKVKKEFALILIAVAAGIKVYPAIFGLLYVREKRWKETIRLLIYGIMLFFIPFAFFGGFAGVKQFFNNQGSVHEIPAKTIYSISALFTTITGASVGGTGSKIATLLVGILFISAFFLLPLKKWQQYFILSVAVILLPFWSGYYTVIYLVLPLIEFFNDSETGKYEKKTDTVFSYINYSLFAIIFSLTIFLYSENKAALFRYCDYLAIYALIISVITQAVIIFVRSKKNGKTDERE